VAQASQQVKTIHELVAESPDEDVRATWEAMWGVLTEAKEKVVAELPVELHPSCADYEYYTPGSFEGSLRTYTGPGVDWLVHSWIGNRQASILDMNLTVWLGQQVDVPHLCLVIGTVPLLYHYTDLVPRRDLAVSPDYLARYYEPANEEWLRFRGDDRFTWSVSHGAYMRSIISPVCHSLMTERTDENMALVREHVLERVDRWLDLVCNAEPVPEADRPALRRRDHELRRLCYSLDPMNALAAKSMGEETVEKMVALRMGAETLEV
jgi:hypothetical protein